jgi:hydroxymethylbilane synthase
VSAAIRLGTRGSPLALAQARWVQARLAAQHGGVGAQLVIIKTSGDRFVDRPLQALGGKGLFVKEIEEALAAGDIDAAVHSLKDVPGELAPGLTIAAVPARADPRDLLVSRHRGGLPALPRGARVGTSSLRRMALLRAARADLDVQPLRGNVDTRLRKLDQGEVDAVVLAAAGLQRLGIVRADALAFDPDDFVPAVGQGALAIECRADETAALLAALDDRDARIAASAERAFLQRLGGSCRTPLAAYATVRDAGVELRGVIASPDGTRVVRGGLGGPAAEAGALGARLADTLLARGGDAVLRALGEAGDGR